MRATDEHGRKQSLRFGSLLTLIMASLILGSLAPAATAGPTRADPKPALDQVKAEKDKEDKRKCNDFRHPCKPRKLSGRMPAIPTTAAASGDVVPRWFYLVNGLSTQSQPLVLTDASTNATNGAFLTIAPVQPGSRGQVWRAELLGDGLAYLHSGLGNAVVLGFLTFDCANTNAGMYNSQQGSPVAGGDGFQTWNFTRAGTTTIGGEVVSLVTIGDPNCAMTLFVDQQTHGNSVLVGTSGAAPGNRWFAWPNYPLEAILNEPPLQFPIGSNQDQKTAYNYINSQLYPPPPSSCTFSNGYSYTGLRCDYTSESANLGGYQSKIQSMVSPANAPIYAGYAGVSTQTFTDVGNQLLMELGDVIVVQELFTDLDGAINTIFINNTIQQNALIGDALGSPTPINNVKGTAAAVLEGVVYTVLSAGGTVTGVFANLMETAINGTAAASDDKVQLAETFEVAANDLWTTLDDSFNAVISTTSVVENAVLTDWGMLQNVEALINSTGPGSLNWNDLDTSTLNSQAGQGHAVSAMQILLPARYQLYRLTSQANGDLITSDTNLGLVPDPAPPSYAQYSQFLATQQDTSYQLWDQYFIADSSGNYPSEAALQTDVFDNGGSPHDLFLNMNGWDFATNDFYLDCWGARTTITNWTGNDLIVTATPQQGKQGGNGYSLFLSLNSDQPIGTDEAVSYPLNAYGAITLGSAYWDQLFNSGLEIYFQVWDYSFSSSASVISFNTHQHSCNETDNTWVDPIYYAVPGNYRYTTPSIVTQSGSNPGAISVGVYLE